MQVNPLKYFKKRAFVALALGGIFLIGLFKRLFVEYLSNQ